MTGREWVSLLVVLLVGLGGLFYASAPHSGASYGIGLIVFGATVVCGFVLLKRHFDRVDAERH